MNKFDLSRSEIENLINEWIFNERDRRILKRRLLDGICYEPLAEEFDLSVRQVKNIIEYDSGSDFSKIVNGMNQDDFMDVMDELMLTLKAINLRLYDGVLRKLQ